MSSKAGKARLYGDGGRMVKRARKGPAPATTAAVKQAVARAVARTGEKKGMDTAITIAGPVIATTNTNGDCIVLNLVQQGAGSWNRIGRKINLQSVRLRGQVRWLNTASSNNWAGNTLRMVVVWDKQPSGAAIPAFDTVFGKTAQDGTESTTFLDAVKYDNMDRFSILRDCVMNFTSQIVTNPITGVAVQLQTFDEFIKLGNREVVFLGQSAPMTIADISTGALYVYFRSAAADNDVNDIAIDSLSFARVRYVDP